MTIQQNTRGGVSSLHARIAAVLQQVEIDPPAVDGPSDDAMRERRQNLEDGRARGAVTEDDFRRIVRNDLGDTMALQAVHGWTQCAFHGKPTKSGGPCPRFLVLHGARGIGKTVAAAWAIANEVGYYVVAGEYRRQRYSYTPIDVERRERAQICKLLVLDDLGYESLMPTRDEEWLLELINERQGSDRYTLITTNESPEVWFRERYGDRAYEKLEHQGALMKLQGMNLRRRWSDAG